MSGGRRPARLSFRATVVRDGREAGSLILHDGQKLRLVRALAEDADVVRAFVERLSELERDEVLGSLRITEQALGSLLDSLSEKSQGAGFVVQGEHDDRVRALGVFKLLSGLKDTASITLAVEPELRRKGVGAVLFEQLAGLAARLGVTRLVGVSQADNRPLAAMFAASGFTPDLRQGDDTTTFLITTRPTPAPEAESTVAVAPLASSAVARLRPLFNPRSIAVVGAARTPGSLGYRLLANLVDNGFDGPVYPVNPAADHIRSISCYPSLAAIGREVDLAVVVVPAALVPTVVAEAADAGVGALIVISAGFSESGHPEREGALAEQVRRLGMRMVGPNGMGVIRTAGGVSMNASLAADMPLPGAVALCSHSGALGIAITSMSRTFGIGLSTFVSVGNRSDLTETDLLEYWEEDPATSVILYYLESFGNPRHFARLARRVGRAKPIVAIKAGRSVAGRRSDVAAESVGSVNLAVESLMTQTGVISADTLEEMFDIARVLTEQPLPQGRRVGIVTNAGGPAILCADALAAAGLLVPPLRESTQEQLRQVLRPEAATRNPVDILVASGPAEYRSAVETVLQADEVDALVVIHTPVGVHPVAIVAEAVAQAVTSVRSAGVAAAKPVLACLVGEDTGVTYLPGSPGSRIPVYLFPESTGSVLAKISTYAAWRRSDPGVFPEFRNQRLHQARKRCAKVLAATGPGWLDHEDAAAILAAAAIPLLACRIVHSADEAAAAAAEVGFPVVMKAITAASDDHFDRLEQGGVVVGVGDDHAAHAAFSTIVAAFAGDDVAALEAVLVQTMAAGCAELKITVRDDPRFGPLVSLALAGGYLEALDDATYGVSPLTDLDAQAMVRRVPGARLLAGYRGHPAADVDALVDILLRVSRLVEAVPDISLLELSPVFAGAPGSGVAVGEARIQIGQP